MKDYVLLTIYSVYALLSRGCDPDDFLRLLFTDGPVFMTGD